MKSNVFTLAQLVKSGKGDPSAVTDAIWEAGYRQPERTAEGAAQITIDTFFYCESFSMPSDLWPTTYEHVLQNELMKAVLGEDFELDGADSVAIAKSVIRAGFKLSAKPVVKESPGMGIAAWLASDDTGLSSKFMASVLTGEFEAENHYPRDPADFGRCLRLVNAVPGLAERIGEMSQHGKHWAVVAANWDEWVEVYRLKDSDRLYRLMQACYEGGE